MTTKPPSDSPNENGLPHRGRARSTPAGEAASSPAVRAADRELGAELEQLVTTLPRQVSHLSRALYRTRAAPGRGISRVRRFAQTPWRSSVFRLRCAQIVRSG